MGDGRPFYCAPSSVEAALGEFKENGLGKEPSEISQGSQQNGRWRVDYDVQVTAFATGSAKKQN